MTKYKKLYEAYKKTLDENDKLTKRVETLENQRRALVKELEKKEDHDKAVGTVLDALTQNLEKSLKAKNVVNMKPEEKDAMCSMFEHLGALILVMKPDKK